MTTPESGKTWTLSGPDGFDTLKLSEKPIEKLGDGEVLVKIRGASLNYRDLVIPLGQYPFKINFPVVPGSDGAGEVVAVGRHVRRFKPGDRVVTLFNQKHLGGPLTPLSSSTHLGGAVDGTFRQYGAFDEEGLVPMPANLNFVEAATLTCAGLTAWNALFGLEGRKLRPGDWVLTQGTGGVSLFALQFAKAAGAKVVSTTGSDAKVSILRGLGADEVINYKTTPEWGAAARALTPAGRGFDHIVEVAGPASMKQSLGCVTLDGVISVIGFVGGASAKENPSFLECLSNVCIVRGVLVGSRVQMEEMCRAVEAAGDRLKPVVDPTVFTLERLREAYDYQWGQKHYGNVGVEI